MTAFLERYFTISAWGPGAGFDLLRLYFDWLRHPEHGYFSVAACLFGFGVCVSFHPTAEEAGDITDDWLGTTHVIVPTLEYDALVNDAEAWRRAHCKQADPINPGQSFQFYEQRPDYFANFGPNVPVEDLGGMEKAP